MIKAEEVVEKKVYIRIQIFLYDANNKQQSSLCSILR